MSNYNNPYYMDTSEIIGLFLFLVVMLIALIGLGIQIYNDMTLEQVDTIKVDCFDRFGNKIVGEVCLEKVYCGNIDYYFKSKGCEVKK